MTCQNDCSQFDPAMALLIENGFDGVAGTIEILLNNAMQIVRSRHLQASPCERTDSRQDYANGYKPKNMKTRFGEVHLEIPQTRKSDFYPQSLERALNPAVAEMYVLSKAYRRGKLLKSPKNYADYR